jgi:hypothetical protein
MHISRSGQMAPYGDDLASTSETKASLAQTVRERAYFLGNKTGALTGVQRNTGIALLTSICASGPMCAYRSLTHKGTLSFGLSKKTSRTTQSF